MLRPSPSILRFPAAVCLAFLTLCSGVISAAAESQPVDRELRDYLKETITSSTSFKDRFEAEVWLVDMSGRLKRFIADKQQRLDLLKQVHYFATQQQISPELILAVIEVESAFDRFAVSWVGAQGLMQVMSFWKKEIGRPDDNLTQVETNLKYGSAILKHYLNREKGNLANALARYNGSYGRYHYSQKVFRAWQKNWQVEPLWESGNLVTR